MRLKNRVDNLQVTGELRMAQGATLLVEDAASVTHIQNMSNRIVSVTATTLTVTAKDHAHRTVVLGSTHTQTVTLPAASGTGDKYKFAVSVTGTDGSKVIQVANTADVMTGVHIVHSTSTAEASSFLTSATSDTYTANNTTTGGIMGTTVEIEDIASGKFLVRVDAVSSGTVATGFSASV